MNIKQVKKDITDGKIESFSVLNFYKVVYITYKNGPVILYDDNNLKEA